MPTPPAAVKEIFLRASELPPGERPAFLDEACGPDADLRRRVEALLSAHEDPCGFLDSRSAAEGPTVDEVVPGPGPEDGPTSIGPYGLLKALGEGGMGVVYLAEEGSGGRKVALKLIKPGMGSRHVLARFEAERQILTMMDHPNIARLLAAGTAQGGRPYFVMEYIPGVPINRYCDESRLTVRERLELFLHVCEAIDHAHKKGVIHRDIKPSNALVMETDGRPVPKVIDFGIAKATDQRAEGLLHTIGDAAVGTVLYMAPEQANPTPLGVDPRADVYSLGVLLYELLTGTTPLERARMEKLGLVAQLRLVCEETPPPPSARVASAADLARLAHARREEPAKLAARLAGDLDLIAMKCLARERAGRYGGAKELADDVRSHLRDEPLKARPPSTGEVLRRFARKNWKTLAAAAAFVLLLIVGVAVTGWLAVRATRAEQRMEAERDRAQLGLTHQIAARIDGELKRLSLAGNALRAAVAGDEKLGDDKKLERFMRDVLVADERIFGLTLGFEPEAFKGMDHHCFYVYRTEEKGTGQKRITRKDLLKREYNHLEKDWYTIPRDTGHDLWGKPYFDGGGGDVWMVSYSMRLVNREKKFVGVLTVDLKLADLTSVLDGWLQGQNTRWFLADGDRRVIGHADFTDPGKEGELAPVAGRYPGLPWPLPNRADIHKAAGGRRYVSAPVQETKWWFVTVIE